MKKHQVLLLLFSILNVATLKAKVEIASIFNDNMVLQQQMDVNIWGTASPNKKVTIQPTSLPHPTRMESGKQKFPPLKPVALIT